MEFIRQALAIFSDPTIGLSAIVAGLLFGIFYNGRLRLPPVLIYHKLIAGLGFISTIFFFRLLEGRLNFAGWIGVGLLWTLFILCIWIGYSLYHIIDRRRTQRRIRRQFLRG